MEANALSMEAPAANNERPKRVTRGKRMQRKVAYLVKENEELEDFAIELLAAFDIAGNAIPPNMRAAINKRREELDFPAEGEE